MSSIVLAIPTKAPRVGTTTTLPGPDCNALRNVPGSLHAETGRIRGRNRSRRAQTAEPGDASRSGNTAEGRGEKEGTVISQHRQQLTRETQASHRDRAQREQGTHLVLFVVAAPSAIPAGGVAFWGRGGELRLGD